MTYGQEGNVYEKGIFATPFSAADFVAEFEENHPEIFTEYQNSVRNGHWVDVGALTGMTREQRDLIFNTENLVESITDEDLEIIKKNNDSSIFCAEMGKFVCDSERYFGDDYLDRQSRSGALSLFTFGLLHFAQKEIDRRNNEKKLAAIKEALGPNFNCSDCCDSQARSEAYKNLSINAQEVNEYIKSSN